MIDAAVSPMVLFVLRQFLFLGPLALLLLLLRPAPRGPRDRLGALFSFFYAMPLVFVGHVWAIEIGLWRYQGDALKVLGFPADIWFGGALLWGPVLFLAFPRLCPWIPAVAVIALNGLLMPAFEPFVTVGPGWFAGVVVIFAAAHLPALYLARWTATNVKLPLRAFLLAVAYGAFAFFTLPTIIMHAMGGSWEPLLHRSTPALTLAAVAVGACFVVGLTAVQVFAVHGGGTPIPLDPTKRLVRTGIYAYLRNPMQSSTALAWIIMGLALSSIWVALAAAMAVCFVLGMVRWHHRQDLEIRFPEGWAEYRANVPEWFPRWRPWVRSTALLRFNPARVSQRWLAAAIAGRNPTGLRLLETGGDAEYRAPDEAEPYHGLAALVKGLEHISLPWAVFAAGLLLILLPARWCVGASTSDRNSEPGDHRA